MLESLNVTLTEILTVLAQMGGICAMLATIIPESMPILGPIIHKIGMNFGQAKNN
jgi:hypothetical protein